MLNNGTPICSDVGLVRLHNLPRYTSMGDILHFLWSAVDFEPVEALVCAFSANNAIVRFRSQYLADDAVRFCSGRSICGQIVTVHASNIEELERVKNECTAFPAELKKKIAAKRDGPTDMAKGNCATNDYPAFPGLLVDSDDDGQDFDDMELRVPDFFLRGRAPDLVDFDGADDSTGGSSSRPGTSSSCGDFGDNNEHNGFVADQAGMNTTSSSMSISMTADESEAGSEEGTAGGGASADGHQQQQQGSKRKLSSSATATHHQHDNAAWKRLRQGSAPNVHGGAALLANVPPSRHSPNVAGHCRPPLPPHPFSSAPASAVGGGGAFFPPLPPLCPAAPPPWPPQQQNDITFIDHHPLLPPLPPPPPAPQFQFYPVVFTTVISARHILLQWQLPSHDAPFEVDNQTLTIVCHQYRDKDKKSQHMLQLGRRTEHLFEVCAGQTYAVTLEGYDVPGNKVTHGADQFRATFARTEMEALYKRAKIYCGDQMYPLDVLHRSKPKAYWDEIYDSPGGLRIMRPYTKDDNGHPGCPINGSIDGLFFSTLLRGKHLPKDSPFGDVQMVVSARKLLDFDTCNLYFADFYCNSARADDPTQSSILHYVTVVVCKHDSISDRFCKSKKLIQMDWFNNPFLKVHLMAGSPTATPQYLAVCRQFNQYKLDTLVEVYYTEPFSLFEAEEFNEMGTIGKGSSRKEGIPNNKHCSRCNIYEVRRCTTCSNAFPFYPRNNGGIPPALCPKCDPNPGRSQLEFA